jgi:integrase
MLDADRLAAARATLAQLAAVGLTLADLFAATSPTVPTQTVAEYLPTVRAAAGPSRAKTYGPYWDRLAASTLAARPLAEIRTSDLLAWVTSVEQNALRRRNTRGGRSARENAISAARFLFRCAVDDGLITTNPALAVPKPRRQPAPRRGLTNDEITELDAVTCSGGNDPALDTLLVRLHLETGCRRGGALGLTLADLGTRPQCVRLHEKGGTVRHQPVSLTLLNALTEHAAARGATKPTDAVLRYYTGAPLTRRRYNTLTERWRKSLPWVAAEGISPHWLRHTAGTAVERLAGYAVAGAFLGHAPSGGATTSTYITASIGEVAAAVELLTGEPHPLATHSVPLL